MGAVRKRESVGRDARCQFRELVPYELQRSECLFVGERVSGSGDAYDAEIGDPLLHIAYLLDGLLGCEDLAGHAGARFVAAIELPVAVVALDVAARSNGDMHPGEGTVGLLVVAGVRRQCLFDTRV